MANSILLHHPLASVAADSDLAIVFDYENPFLMPLDRFEELIGATPPGELRGYLYGLYDQRKTALCSGSPQ